MPAIVEPSPPFELSVADLRPRGEVCPSPVSWRDQVLYFLLPDRFNDGGEACRSLFDRADPQRCKAPDKGAWMAAGKAFQGGTLKGIESKLDYLQELGVTALWIGPVWRQRPNLETYHGYGIQNFLEVDPRFGTRQDLRDLVDVAHARKMYVLLDVIYNHSGNNWFYDRHGTPRETLPYRFQPPYPFHGWRSGIGQSTAAIAGLEDGAWPREFQNIHWYARADQIGLALRRGRQYLRETSFLGRAFAVPERGELIAWSRLFHHQEVLVALNSHGTQERGAHVTVDAALHPPGSAMSFLYHGAWSDAQLRHPPQVQTVPVEHDGGRATVRLDLPPAGMAILA